MDTISRSHYYSAIFAALMCKSHARIGQDCQVRVLDRLRPARIIAESPYDPDNILLRS